MGGGRTQEVYSGPASSAEMQEECQRAALTAKASLQHSYETTAIMMSQLSQEVLSRIDNDFRPEDQAKVVRLLSQYIKEDLAAEIDSIRMGILELSKGRVGDVAHYVRMARYDYRDILYWAYSYDEDF